jgi:hypothetical protein
MPTTLIPISTNNCPFNMVQVWKRIANISMNTFLQQIILIGPFFKETCAKNATWRTKGAHAYHLDTLVILYLNQ